MASGELEEAWSGFDSAPKWLRVASRALRSGFEEAKWLRSEIEEASEAPQTSANQWACSGLNSRSLRVAASASSVQLTIRELAPASGL